MATRVISESEIIWRGSIGDLATDCAYLLTRGEGKQLIAELQRFLDEDHLASKFKGAGHRIEEE